MQQQKKVFDITIIGGGPVGLFTAFYAGMRKCSVKIIESLPQLGGQLTALYPDKFIYDIAGFPKIRAQDLIDNLKNQMNQFNPIICINQSVQNIEKQEDGLFQLKTNFETHYSKSVIITAGNGAFQPKKLSIEGIDKYERQNLHYFISDLSRFKGKRVVVLGGGDSAVDWSLMLEPIAKEIQIVHRRDTFRAHEKSVEDLENSKVQVLTPFVPVELIGEEKIEKVILEDAKGTQKMTLEIDEMLVNYGFSSSLGPIKQWGLEIKKNSIVVNNKMETNIPGIFAVGDICTYEGKLKLISCGFGEAPIAVSRAKVFIDPTTSLQTPHSTSLMS